VKVLRVGPPSGRTLHQRVTLEGGATLRVRAAEVASLGLAAGMEIGDDTCAQLRVSAQASGALASALRLLAVRLRSHSEIEGRLSRRGYPPQVVATVVAQLDREGFLDDTRFSKAWVSGRQALRPSGAARLRSELRQKGVAADVIEGVLREAVPEGAERAQAAALARARVARYRGESREVAMRRVAGVLQRRGFSSGAIAAALREVFGRAAQVME
jgi:regulatory protein